MQTCLARWSRRRRDAGSQCETGTVVSRPWLLGAIALASLGAQAGAAQRATGGGTMNDKGLACTQAAGGAGGAVEIGRTWSGVGTDIGALMTPGGHVIVASYDEDRWVRVTDYDPRTNRLCHVRLPSRFAGWDAHNALAIALSADGTLHVAGNAHASPLFYASGRASDIASIAPSDLPGLRDRRATYPRFLHDAGGGLMLFYRIGGSGDGAWSFNRWQNGRWSPPSDVFGGDDGGRHVSAYPTGFVRAPDGSFHVAVIWRATPDVASNFAVTYARTRDFVHWTKSDGAAVPLPLSVGGMETVERVGEGHGLNSASLLLDASGKPVIFYLRYGGAKGTDALVAARPAAHGWRTREVALSDNHTPVEGRGAMSGLPAYFLVDQDGDDARFRLRFPPDARPHIAVRLDDLSARPDDRPPPDAGPGPLAKADFGALADPERRHTSVLAPDGRRVGQLQWFAQSANQDRPRSCSAAAPKACDPPASPLLWIPE